LTKLENDAKFWHMNLTERVIDLNVVKKTAFKPTTLPIKSSIPRHDIQDHKFENIYNILGTVNT